MTSSSPQIWKLVVWALMPVFLSVTEATPASHECSFRRFGKLTMFNGETANVELPCKVRLADFQCGDFRVRVMAGQLVDSYQANKFSAETLRVKITRPSTDQTLILRTSVYLLRKAMKGINPDPWMDKPSNMRQLMNLDFVGYEAALNAAVVRQTGVFEVLFSSTRLQARRGDVSADDAGVVVRCFHPSFTSGGLEDSLCGDGTTPEALRARKSELYGCGSDLSYTQLLHHLVLNDNTVTQSTTCQTLTQQYQSCPFQENAIRTCGAIMGQLTLTFCLAPEPATAFPSLYGECLKYACDGDLSAITTLRTHVLQNCPALNSTIPEATC